MDQGLNIGPFCFAVLGNFFTSFSKKLAIFKVCGNFSLSNFFKFGGCLNFQLPLKSKPRSNSNTGMDGRTVFGQTEIWRCAAPGLALTQPWSGYFMLCLYLFMIYLIMSDIKVPLLNVGMWVCGGSAGCKSNNEISLQI